MSSKGMEGYTQLTQLLRPHRDLRGFYFGVQSVVYRMCIPTKEADTSYSELREIKVQVKGDVLYVDYQPFRREKVVRMLYIANIRSPDLTPLAQPKPQGEDDLGGYFSKEDYGPILIVLQDIVTFSQSGGSAFKQREIRSMNGMEGVLKRVESQEEGNLVLGYRFYIRHPSGKEIASEEIRFFFEKNPKA